MRWLGVLPSRVSVVLRIVSGVAAVKRWAAAERGGDAAHAAYGSDNVGARYLVTKSMPECKNLALHERAAMVLELIGKSSNVLVENIVGYGTSRDSRGSI